jgi:hypothetical protein
MMIQTIKGDIWTVEKGDWISSKYYDKAELIKKSKKRNLIFISSLMLYLFISAALIFF